MDAEKRFGTLRRVGESLNGYKTDHALWTGVPVDSLLEEAGVQSGCECVMLRAEDDYYEEFPIDALRGGMLAYGMNAKILPRGHGYPVRALVRATGRGRRQVAPETPCGRGGRRYGSRGRRVPDRRSRSLNSTTTRCFRTAADVSAALLRRPARCQARRSLHRRRRDVGGRDALGPTARSQRRRPRRGRLAAVGVHYVPPSNGHRLSVVVDETDEQREETETDQGSQRCLGWVSKQYSSCKASGTYRCSRYCAYGRVRSRGGRVSNHAAGYDCSHRCRCQYCRLPSSSAARTEASSRTECGISPPPSIEPERL